MTEKSAWKVNGFLALLLFFALIGGAVYTVINFRVIVPGALMIFLAIILVTGIHIVQPNQAKVLTFFGTYMGSIREPGFG